MKWLTISDIKKHCRIDLDIEDDLLTLYGNAAEDMVMNIIGRDYTEIIEKYGEVPKPLVHASLILVELSYTQRSAISQAQMYVVPYTFDFLVKPYMKLTYNDNLYNSNGNCKNF